MAKRPKDSPFGALADLRDKVRSAGPQQHKPASKPPATAAAVEPLADDVAAFFAAVGDAAPLPASQRASIERPRPAPVPRPRAAEPDEASPPKPARHADPNDPLALFNEAMVGVAPIRDNGRADLGRRTAHPRGSPRPAVAEAPAKAAPTLALPADLNDPQALFRHVVGNAAPLPDRNLATLDKPLPPPRPIKREEDEAEALKESIEAPLSFQDRLDIGDESVHLHEGIPRRVLTDLRRGRWVVQDELDLHGLTRDEARTALSSFLSHALEQGFRCVRLIHGKGLGSPGREPVLKHLSRGWLMQRAEILAFCQARPHDGGEGALLILLRNQKKTG
jgi:DNA-nicking Smr family endonuclease